MKKWIIRIAATLAVLFIILLILPFAFKGKILKMAKEGASSSVNAKITFDDDISISLIQNFPNISVGINNLKIVGVDSFSRDTLFNAKELRLTIDINSVLGENKPIGLRKIYMNEPKINVIFLKSGKANFDIAKADTTQTIDTTTSPPIAINLNDIEIENGDITYNDASMAFAMSLLKMNFQASGDFTEEVFTLDNTLDAEKFSMSFDGMTLLSNTKLVSKSAINMDLKTFRFGFDGIDVKLNEFPLLVKGWLQMNEKNMDMDVNMEVPTSEFKSLLSIVPGCYTKDFDQVKATGKMGFAMAFKGIMDDVRMPTTNLSMNVNNASFQYPGLPTSVNNINVDFKLVNADGNPDNTTVDLSRFDMNLGGDPMNAKLYLKSPVSNPYARGFVNATLNLEKWTSFMPLDKGTNLKGKITSNLTFDGHYSQVVDQKINDLKASGELNISNLLFKAPDLLPLNIRDMQLKANPATFSLNKLDMAYGKSSLNMTGELKNLMGYVFHDETLVGKMAVNSESIDLNEWMPAENPSATPAAADTSAMEAPMMPENLDIEFKANAKSIDFESYHLENCIANINLKKGILSINPIKASLWGSQFELNQTEYAYAQGGNPSVKAGVSLGNLVPANIASNISMVNQYAPILKEVEGLLNLKFGMNSQLQNDLSPNLKSLAADGVLDIVKGQMNAPKWMNEVFNRFNWGAEKLKLEPTKLGFNITDGKLNLKDSIKVKLPKGGTMRLKGNVALDQSIDFGGKLTAEGKTVPLRITGTVNKPVLKIDWKALGKEMVKGYVDDAKNKATQQANKMADDAMKKAHDQGENIMKEAKEKADLIRSESRKLAEKQRAEGEKLADEAVKRSNAEIDQLMAKASNPLEKIAAKKAGEKLKQSAQKKADEFRSKSANQAQETETKGQEKANQLEQQAQMQMNLILEQAQREKEKQLPR